MRHLVIGLGEVGKSVREVLQRKYEVEGLDHLEGDPEGKFYYIHICIPFTNDFIGTVRHYESKYKEEGGLTIVHSTVQVGTCDELNAVHSPIRGKHPNLVGGIDVFVKYFGGERSKEAMDLFLALGVCCMAVKKSRECEAGKLWDTTQYGWNIVLMKEIKKWCDQNEIDFDFIYSHWNTTYNEGYEKLKMKNVTRPVLDFVEGKIGGHCVVPNAEMLKDNLIGQTILDRNKLYD